MKNKSTKIQSARLSDKTMFWIARIQINIQVYLFFMCKFNIFTIHLAPNIMIGLTIASGVSIKFYAIIYF